MPNSGFHFLNIFSGGQAYPLLGLRPMTDRRGRSTEPIYRSAHDEDSRRRWLSNPSPSSFHNAISASRAARALETPNNRIPVLTSANTEDQGHLLADKFSKAANRQDKPHTVVRRRIGSDSTNNHTRLSDRVHNDDIWIRAVRRSANSPKLEQNAGPPEDLLIRAMRGAPRIDFSAAQSGNSSVLSTHKIPRVQAEV